jgi:hypothetical protein|tara:strand:+ start:237 stop:377 length:141 start_codon:yes stop_codon:yes gene_type:complete
MDMGIKATVFCGGIAVFGLVDFSRQLKRLKKLKKEQDANVQAHNNR